jgi:flagellar hook-basal body complex protein FliE
MAAIDSLAMLQNINSEYITDILKRNEESTGVNTGKNSTFDSIYNAAISLVDGTNTYIEDAQQAEVDFALGNMTSAHELGVVQQKASLALQYTVAIRDKLLEAYKEIMNIQI